MALLLLLSIVVLLGVFMIANGTKRRREPYADTPGPSAAVGGVKAFLRGLMTAPRRDK